MAHYFGSSNMLANTSKPSISLPSIHELGLNLTRTDLPNHDGQVVDTHPSTTSAFPTKPPILVPSPPRHYSPTIWDPTSQIRSLSSNHTLDNYCPSAPAHISALSPTAAHRGSLSSNSTSLSSPTSSIASPILWSGLVDSTQQNEPDLTNQCGKYFARKSLGCQRISPPSHRTTSGCIVRPHDLREKPATSKVQKKRNRKIKILEEQKRRRNESYLQRRMQDILLLRGHKFTEPLSEQNMKVSGLRFNKLEIMEEIIYEMEELINPHSALVRHVAKWQKLRVQIPRAEELVTLVTAMPKLSGECERDLGWARLLMEEMQKLLPSQYLNIVSIDMTMPENERKEWIRQLSVEELQQHLTDLAEMLNGELERWRAGKKRLVYRIWKLKRMIAIIESGKPMSTYSSWILNSFHRNKRFPKIFSVHALTPSTSECSWNGNIFVKSRL